MKNTKKIGEFQKFIDNDSKTGLCLEDTLKFFEIQRIFGKFEFIKLVMLFYNSRNIHSYFTRHFGKLINIKGSKNPYYDLLGNEYIFWRSIMFLFVKLLN